MRADGKIPQLQKSASAQLFLSTDWKDLNIVVVFNSEVLDQVCFLDRNAFGYTLT